MVRALERMVPADPGRPELAGPDHPVRLVTRQVAFEAGSWTPERAHEVAAMFDEAAGAWDERAHARRLEPLEDALARGGRFPDRPCLEVGSGTGLATSLLAARFSPVMAVDLSAAMLARAGGRSPLRLRADASALPVADGRAGVVVLVNMFLFPAEVDRVLAPDGVVVWVNTLGDATPIHLPAGDVAAALPGTWDGVAAEAGWGTWATLRRGRAPAAGAG
ncbi:MAG: methyltransferase domain-containing protein [Actinomycetota bacterium]|nr:methyltransferase domain-containing protein [Actinomycetota bacterium]